MKPKESITDLAILGGYPTFSEPLHVGRPNLPNRDQFMSRIAGIFDRCWLSNNGPMVQEFEKRIQDYLDVKHCIATCNGTVALEIAARAAGLTGEVIVPSFTFIATAHALQWQQITPVFCDIDPVSHNISPQVLEELINPRTTGILGVHVWGRPCDINALAKIAQDHNLQLLFDASHAFGCTYDKRYLGNFGLAEIFSFHATKFLNTFEGGAVVTNSDDFAEKLRLMRNFGFAGKDNVTSIGINGKMNEVSAAMGLGGLEQLELIVATNHDHYLTYSKQLEHLPGVSIISYDTREKHNYQYIILEIDDEKAGISRDQLVEILHAENIIARRYFYPGCHQLAPYRTLQSERNTKLQYTEALTHRVLSLPNGLAIDKDMVLTVCDLIRFSITHAKDIKQARFS